MFKEYPIGVSILSVDESKGRTIRWLLDGCQRKNALAMKYDDPENIYNWAKKFIGFKNSDQPSEIEEKFYAKINEYIEVELDEEYEVASQVNAEDDSEAQEGTGEDSFDLNSYGLAKFKHPTHQISFHTQRALDTLTFLKGSEVHDEE